MKRVIVIGGSGTVGRALCRELSEAGARVGATHHRGNVPDGVIGRALDLTQPAAIAPCLDELIDELGGVDALVHCAVVSSTVEPPRFDALDDVTSEGWDRLMAINVRSAFFAARHAAARMQGGNIVFLGSVDGIKPVESPVPYAASKAALHGIVMSLAKALGKRNIRVNIVAPGILEAGASRDVPAELREEYLRHSGLRRLGRINEVTGIIAWLALENSYVTGQTVSVDGGL